MAELFGSTISEESSHGAFQLCYVLLADSCTYPYTSNQKLAIKNKSIASSNKCLTSSNKLVETISY